MGSKMLTFKEPYELDKVLVTFLSYQEQQSQDRVNSLPVNPLLRTNMLVLGQGN